MFDSVKNMFNVVDISSLMLTVGHPNGTLTKITAIGSLRLTSGIILFDVLVVLKYNVSLLSVNKMIKDSKFFVGFDEHKCYIQDLNMGKLVGTGNETGGLYLFDIDKCGKSNGGICNSVLESFMYNVTLGWIIDSGANQHMSNSTKNMFNVVDISSIMLTVGHPNGTLAKITAIGSLRLTSGVILFDVLVVLEYNVSLLSVNKTIKDSKFFVGFDEHKCYIQDLNLGKLVGTGSKTGGLYLFDIDKCGKSNGGICNSVFVCHVSSELWHCRLGHPTDRGPYKVIIDSGANQHMSNSTKNIFNVVDISSLMLTIGHPNGTLAKITAIGSLRLTSGIILFDVLVVSEYNDLNLGKLVGTGSEIGGLYLFDIDKCGKSNGGICNSVFVCHVSSKLWHYRLGYPTNRVLYILGKKLGFSINDHNAKQTREPFPLSDHKFVSVDDIVHCDVWGPYKVVSKDGYNFESFMYNVTLGWIIDSGANQHMSDSTKNMFNVADISSLMLTVGHPNGALAKITAICILRLTSGIILFDVLVVPEYNDLNLGKLVGTGSENDGLYLFDIDKCGKTNGGGIPLSVWPECMLSDVYLINKLPSLVLSGGSPYFLVYGKDPSLSHIRPERPNDEDGDTSNVVGNRRVVSDNCDIAVENETATIATQIGDNLTFEGNDKNNQNGDDPSIVLKM
ncbi:hypothetical protein Tco_0038917 [Tanacetum coccineum]